ncbi:unnamed protein product [Hymenolepis diminuta]|uniref:Ovule protein n=1 Tax=Hymenolepis diminuta TaxID=6216 RepID=A0A0R3SYT5_HYMDI|nr:unnamed protein product [Hymenolepis diminuta]
MKTRQACHLSEVDKHTKTALEIFPLPHFRFYHVHIDTFRPLPLYIDFSYLLTCVDCFSRWQDAFLCVTWLPNPSPEPSQRWIATFTVSSTITTDRRTPSESQHFSEVTNPLGTNRVRTTEYHPLAKNLFFLWLA